jgi:hypothetical protein
MVDLTCWLEPPSPSSDTRAKLEVRGDEPMSANDCASFDQVISANATSIGAWRSAAPTAARAAAAGMTWIPAPLM